MRNTKYNYLFIILMLISFTFSFQSCSEEDPCDAIICENGSCQDGSCLCDEGWIGTNCAQRDLSGEYIMIGYTTLACPDYFDTDIQGNGSSKKLCGMAEEFSICYEFAINLSSDFNYVGNWALFLNNDDGSVETIYDNTERGKWRFEGDESFRTTRDGSTGFKIYEFDGSDRWIITGNTPDGGLGCRVRETYIRN